MGIVQVLQKPTEKRHLHKVFLKGPKLNKKKKVRNTFTIVKVQMYRTT